MAYNNIITSAPGSVMLFGEHAVLHGHPSIAMAIEPRIQVSLTPRPDNKIIIESSHFGLYETTLSTLTIQKPFDFILGVIQSYQTQLITGFYLNIQTSLSSTKGFGTSASVTVAMVAALEWLITQTFHKPTIFLKSRHIIQTVQGLGSGTDAFASTMGNIVYYRMNAILDDALPHIIVPENPLPLSFIYCGYKTPTKEVIHFVNQRLAEKPQEMHAIFARMHTITTEAKTALLTGDMTTLGQCMNTYQQCQFNLGVSDDTSETILSRCQQYPILGAKISGSGKGDCLAVLGTLPHALFPTTTLPQTEQITISMDITGVKLHVDE